MVRETQSTREAQSDAQGALREALSALGNLEQLLRSRNVGPKAISSVLPDIATSCDQLLQRLKPFYECSKNEHNQECLSRVDELLSVQLEQLSSLLGKATKRKPLNATTRLKVEAAVVKIVRELGGVLPLFELLVDASQEGPTMDWLEALSLSRSGDQSLTPGTTHARANLQSDFETVTASMAPRFALNLVRVGAALVVRPEEPLRLAFGPGPNGPELTIDRRPANGPSVDLLLPCVIETTAECLAASAIQRGLVVARDDDRLTFSWSVARDEAALGGY